MSYESQHGKIPQQQITSSVLFRGTKTRACFSLPSFTLLLQDLKNIHVKLSRVNHCPLLFDKCPSFNSQFVPCFIRTQSFLFALKQFKGFELHCDFYFFVLSLLDLFHLSPLSYFLTCFNVLFLDVFLLRF